MCKRFSFVCLFFSLVLVYFFFFTNKLVCKWQNKKRQMKAIIGHLLFFRDGIIQICFSKFLAKPNGHTASLASSIPSTFRIAVPSGVRTFVSSILLRKFGRFSYDVEMLGAFRISWLSSNGFVCSFSLYSSSGAVSIAT